MHTAVSHVTDIHVTEYRRHIVKAVEGGVVTRGLYVVRPRGEDKQCSGSATPPLSSSVSYAAHTVSSTCCPYLVSIFITVSAPLSLSLRI